MKPKLLIIVLFQNLGEENAWYAKSPAPPVSGALLAGLTPPIVEIELLHEMIRPIDYSTDADYIALSFMDYCSDHAIRVAEKFRKLGKKVVAGGRCASTFPELIVDHMDATVVGEAEMIWADVVNDLVTGNLKKLYYAPFAPELNHIPPPRYDLIEKEFAVPVVTEATRGCIYRCSYCQLSIQQTPFRKRPIQDVINDLKATEKLPLLKRKIAMLQDNNLGGDMHYAKELLREIARLKLWSLGVQFSFDCLHDDEFVNLLVEANCGLAFIGLESLNEPSLAFVHKKQNKISEYQELFLKLKKHGILTFTGMMLALDEDTEEYYKQLPSKLEEIDPSAILLSISIPIPGTPFHTLIKKEQRITDSDLSHYDGDHLVHEPRHVNREQVFNAFKQINLSFYSWRNIFRRWFRFVKAARINGGPLYRFAKLVFLSVMLFKISLFQKDHASKRIFRAQFI